VAGFFLKKSRKVLTIKPSKHMKTFWTFLSGVAAGTVIALLYAPDRGTETRRRISDSARRMTGNLKERAEEGWEDMQEMGERAGSKIRSSTGRNNY
jgi:gas vesicle protein